MRISPQTPLFFNLYIELYSNLDMPVSPVPSVKHETLFTVLNREAAMFIGGGEYTSVSGFAPLPQPIAKIVENLIIIEGFVQQFAILMGDENDITVANSNLTLMVNDMPTNILIDISTVPANTLALSNLERTPISAGTRLSYKFIAPALPVAFSLVSSSMLFEHRLS